MSNCYDCNDVEDVGYDMPDERDVYNILDEDQEYAGHASVVIQRDFDECEDCGCLGVPDFGYIAKIRCGEGFQFDSPKFGCSTAANAFIIAWAVAMNFKAEVDRDRMAEMRAAAQGRPY